MAPAEVGCSAIRVEQKSDTVLESDAVTRTQYAPKNRHGKRTQWMRGGRTLERVTEQCVHMGREAGRKSKAGMLVENDKHNGLTCRPRFSCVTGMVHTA